MIKLHCIKLYNSLGNMQRFTFLSYYVSMRLGYTILFPQPRKCRLTDMYTMLHFHTDFCMFEVVLWNDLKFTLYSSLRNNPYF